MNRLLVVAAVLSTIMIMGCLPGSDVVSKAEYNQIESGMSYYQVVSIIGESGTESSSSKLEGVPGVMDSITTKMYIWQNLDGSNMNAMFQNDELVTKAQFGLK